MSNKCNSVEELVQKEDYSLFIVAHDIRSAYNIGAIFRTADGAGGTGVIITGYTPTPENPKVAKTALGADNMVPWVSASLDDVMGTENVHHIGLEFTRKSVDLFTFNPSNDAKILLYIGNEVTGLSTELLMRLEMFLKLPMNGLKNSLNVAEATSIAIYEFLRKRS